MEIRYSCQYGDMSNRSLEEARRDRVRDINRMLARANIDKDLQRSLISERARVQYEIANGNSWGEQA